MNKRGISNVVVVILIVLIVFLLVVLSWNIILPLLKEKSEITDAKNKILFESIGIKNVEENQGTMRILIEHGPTKQLINVSGSGQTTISSVDFFSVVDTSLSMKGERLDAAKTANIQFINDVIDTTLATHRIGLVSYNSDAENGFHPLSNDTNSLTSTVNSWSASGNTCICCGINKATLGFEPPPLSPALMEDVVQLNNAKNDLEFVQLDTPVCNDISDCAPPTTCKKVECISNACVYSPVADGTSCEDGDLCTSSETCNSGTCVPGDTINCPDDGIECTEEYCNPSTGTCTASLNYGKCSNGIYCDGTEICNPTLGCQPGAPIDCSDNYECTTSANCNEATNRCEYEFNDTYCKDNDLGDLCNPPGSDPSGCMFLPSDELLLDMRFDDDLTDRIATDSSTYKNDGTCFGLTCPTYLENKGINGAGAYRFDGGNNFLTLPAINPGNEMTIMAWVKKTASSISESVICQYNNGYKWCLFIFDSKPAASFTTVGGASTFFVYSSTVVPLNKWAHLAVTYKEGKVKIYINGEKVKESIVPGAGAISSSTGSATIGRTNPFSGGRFKGLMDNVKIYSRALKEDEIKDIVDSDTTAVCGDGAIQAGEGCDDGNTNSGDGCSSTCQLEEYPRAIIVMSDGEADTTCPEQGTGNAELDAIQAAQEANALGILVYTIGFNEGLGGFDENTLKEIATAGGGKYFSADISQLIDTYTQIVESITTQYTPILQYSHLRVIFYNATDTEVQIIENPPALPFETKLYEFNPELTNITKIEIYPAILTSSGVLVVNEVPKDVWEISS